MSDGPASAQSEARPRFSELAASALRYWEPRRVLYNLALFVVVLVHFFLALPGSRSVLTFDMLFVLFILAVLSNVAYCAAYAVDLFVQFSALRVSWPRWRWLVLVTGTAFAAAITHFFAQGLFQSGPPAASGG